VSARTNWKERIVELVLVKQAIDERGSGLWEYRLPGLAATPEQLAAVEARLGEPLDAGFRAFLEHAGGWPAFWQTVDLLGPDDLLGSERGQHAIEMLGFVEHDVLEAGGLRRQDLLPIAASRVDLDLFVMTRRSSRSPGSVIWLAGSEIERWSSFDDFFLAMIDYNRLELQQLGEGGAD